MNANRGSIWRYLQLATVCGFLLAALIPTMTAAQVATPIIESTFPPFEDGKTFDTLLLNFTEEDGGTVLFPAGQEMCLTLTITPSLTGPIPFATPCYNGAPRNSIWAGVPANPFLTTSTYAISVASNDTSCTIASLSMETSDFGAGGAYAIINVTVSCPDFEVKDPETYEELRLRFANRGAPETLPGEICVSIVAEPPLDRGPLNSCTTLAENEDFWLGSAVDPLPLSSSYTTTVISNNTGCSAIANPLTEFSNTFGNVFGTIVVDIDCGPPWSSPNYSALRIVYTNDGTAPATLTGPICVQIDTNPPGGLETPQVCGTESNRLYSKPSTPAYPLLRSSTYTASVYRNDTECWALPQTLRSLPFGDGVYIAEIIVLIGCGDQPTPTPTLTPTPFPTATMPAPDSTPTIELTATSSTTAAATFPTLPTETSTALVPTSTVGEVDPESTKPSEEWIESSPDPEVALSITPTVLLVLPSTGSGSQGGHIGLLSILMATFILVATGLAARRRIAASHNIPSGQQSYEETER